MHFKKITRLDIIIIIELAYPLIKQCLTDYAMKANLLMTIFALKITSSYICLQK